MNLRALVGGLVVAGGVAGALVISGVTGGGSAPTGTANLWVDTNGGTCVRQSTAGAYVDAQACASPATAFVASSPDDTIKVKAGTYGTNTLAGSHGTSGHPVTITSADGESPVLGETQFNASNITLQDIAANIYVCKGATGCAASPSSVSNIAIQRVTSQGSWWIRGGSNITVSDSELCCWTDFTSQVTDATNVTFDGVTFHDARLVTPGSHTDCMGIFGGTVNVTVRNSKFYDCEHADILVDNSVSGAFNQGLVVENNYFDVALTPGVNLGLTKCSPGCVVSNNSFRGSAMSQVDNASGALIYSNVFEGTVNDTSICSNATWTYNLWTGATGCSGTGNLTSTATGWASASGTQGASDLHFSSCGAAGVNSAHPTLFPTDDFDGVARPQGATADRGAFEKVGC